MPLLTATGDLPVALLILLNATWTGPNRTVDLLSNFNTIQQIIVKTFLAEGMLTLIEFDDILRCVSFEADLAKMGRGSVCDQIVVVVDLAFGEGWGEADDAGD